MKSEMAAACLQALCTLMLDATASPSAVSKTLRDRLGPGWTSVSAVQWLTGKAAAEFFARQPADGSIAGIPMTAVPVFLAIAKEICSQFGRQPPAEAEFAERLHALGKQFGVDIPHE
jgi:hypothetical protein